MSRVMVVVGWAPQMRAGAGGKEHGIQSEQIRYRSCVYIYTTKLKLASPLYNFFIFFGFGLDGRRFIKHFAGFSFFSLFFLMFSLCLFCFVFCIFVFLYLFQGGIDAVVSMLHNWSCTVVVVVLLYWACNQSQPPEEVDNPHFIPKVAKPNF